LAQHGTKALLSVLLPLGLVLAGGRQVATAAELSLGDAQGCIRLDELSFRVEHLLGQPLEQVEELQLSVHVGDDDTGVSARLEVQRPDAAEPGVRSLHASSCAELLERLAIAIVVAIGDGARPDAAVSAPVPAAEPLPAAQPDAADLPASAEPVPAAAPAGHEASAGPTLAAAAWAIADSGTLPASALGASLGVGLAWRSLELRALGTFLPEREGTLIASDPRSPGVSIGLLAGGLVGCVPVALQTQSLGMAVCAGAELGQLSGSGTRVVAPYQRQTLWAAARVELAARLRLGETPLGLELLATALAPFTRDEFILRDLGEIHRPASVIARLGLGLTLAVD
jgi:hypothetical protein